MPHARRSLALATLFSTLLGGAAAAQTTDFQVNTYTTGWQYRPSVAAVPAFGFLVTWWGAGDGDTDNGVFARGYDAQGAPYALPFRVNSTTAGLQRQPAAVPTGAGGFVVVWASRGQDGDYDGVVGQRYNTLGAPAGSEFQVNSFTNSNQNGPAVVSDAVGNFVVAWSSFGGDGSSYGVSGQRYNGAGVPQGGEFQINTYTPFAQVGPRLAPLPGGGFVAVWSGYRNDEHSFGVFGQRYDASGVRVGGEFRVNSYTTGVQAGYGVATDDAGNFVVVWRSDGGQDGDGSGIFAQRFDAAATPQGSEFQVNTFTTGGQLGGSVGWNAVGEFVVSWGSPGADGYGYAVAARRFRADGSPLGPEYVVNTYTTGSQAQPSIAVMPDGGFLAAWDDIGRGDVFEVFARQVPDLMFADGVESGDLGAWSLISTDGDDLSVSGAAAIIDSFGIQGVVDDTAGLYVQDDTPEDEGRYRARFYVDPNGFDPGESTGARRTRIFIGFEAAPTRRLMAVVLRRVNGQYGIMGRARLDDNSQADTGFFDVADAPHAVEVAWTRSSTPTSNDGTFELWIDGDLRSTLTGLDNHAGAVDFTRLGALSVKPGASGTLYWDAFESRRVQYVGEASN